MVIKKTVAVSILFVGMSTHSALAGNQAQMRTVGLTSQPIGHYEYCKQYKSDCRIKTKNVVAPKLTRKRWNELVEINTYSNNTVAPYTDYEIYKQEEVWAYPSSYGDCEDYVLMKRHMLMELGWPPSSLLITVVLQPNGEGHAVLTVRTSKGDYILDNLENKIKRWDQTPYTYLKRQSESHSGRWKDILDNRIS